MDKQVKVSGSDPVIFQEIKLYGCMKGRIKVVGDILEPLDEVWEVLAL